MTSAELKAIGNRISARRKQLNYTQEQIAEKMDVSIQMVSNLERGNKAIKIDNLIKISEILNVSTDYILTGKHTSKDTDIILNRIANLSDCDYKMVDMIIEYCLNKKWHQINGVIFLSEQRCKMSYLYHKVRKEFYTYGKNYTFSAG